MFTNIQVPPDRGQELQNYWNRLRTEVRTVHNGVISDELCNKVVRKILWDCFELSQLDRPYVEWLDGSVLQLRNFLFRQPIAQALRCLHEDVVRGRTVMADNVFEHEEIQYVLTDMHKSWLQAAAAIMLYMSSAVDYCLLHTFSDFQLRYQDAVISNGSNLLTTGSVEQITLYFECNLIRIAHLFVPMHKGW
jgi:hypothetical protein